MIDIYTDGGVIGKNPSKHGGTWAFVAVRGGASVFENSGILLPESVGTPAISNNMAELIAVMNAVEWSQRWPTTIYTDSIISLYRLNNKKSKWAGIPDPIRNLFLRIRSEHSCLHKAVLVKGHPTKADLERGTSEHGIPVSPWNVRADKLCGMVAAEARSYAAHEIRRGVRCG
jgi:ribonuclease HI